MNQTNISNKHNMLRITTGLQEALTGWLIAKHGREVELKTVLGKHVNFLDLLARRATKSFSLA